MCDYRVSLNTKHSVFPPNSQVTAIVYLKTGKVLKARKIDISVIGIAKTAWYESRGSYGDHHHNQTTHYGDEIYYINGYAILWKSSDGKNILPSGTYQFPFTFTIPENAPPAMNGEHGSISYRIRTNIDIPWAPDEERFCGFSVCPIVDLNLDHRLSRSVTTKGLELESTCCSCSSYPLELQVNMQKTGYTPGENIALKINIINKTSWKIPKFDIGIMENFCFTGRRLYEYDYGYGYQHSMNKFSSHVITAKSVIIDSIVDESKTFYLTVPPLSPSYQACPIIKNDYSLFVKVSTDAVFSSGPGVQLPLTIGSIPIRESLPALNPTGPLQTIVETKNIFIKKSIDETKNNTAEKDNEEVAVSPKVLDEKKKSPNVDVIEG